MPNGDFYGNEPQLLLNFQNFIFLSLSTILIAAAGYIINDYFDIKIDIINRPNKVLLEKMIPLKAAIVAHSFLNLIGLFLAWVVARQTNRYEWLSLQVVCTILLWYYSTKFKRQFMIGNVVVALLTALTITVLIVYEPRMHYYLSKPVFEEASLHRFFLNPVWILGIYIFFAFALTWMREVVKDMEDYKGDAEEGCVTMPIKWGLSRSAKFVQFLGIIVLVVLLVSMINVFLSGYELFSVYILLALIVPLVYWIFILNKKATQDHYNKASRNLKIIMLLGILSLVVYHLI